MPEYSIDFTHYHRYDELVKILRDLAGLYPDFTALQSVGQSYEGRDLWLMEITNKKTGPGDTKPAFYIDANIHAGEVTGCAVALYTIWYLLTKYGQEAGVTELLDTTVFYILPRVSVDGAELYLTTPAMLRSSTRPYPDPEDEWLEQEGLVPEDVNGDGLILQMRIKDDNGNWKVSASDPRLMVQRAPDDRGGQYYRLYQEGVLKNWDGGPFDPVRPKWGLDINRNWPSNWAPEVQQTGSGPYPLSEPETRAVAEFIVKHKNIGGVMAYHTSGGEILRPFGTKSDDKMPPKDLIAYRTIADRGKQLTGYTPKSVFEDYTADKSKPLRGVFMDWTYEQLGIITYSTELWNLAQRAGIPERAPAAMMKLTDREREEDGLKLLKWNDEVLGGEGFVNWMPFKHPQLGEVELGGWKNKFVRQNPPPKLLPEECHKNAMFTLTHALALPRLAFSRVDGQPVGGEGQERFFKVQVTVQNQGYLPTSVSDQAVAVKATKPIEVSVTTGDGVELVAGKDKEEIGQLEGRVGNFGAYFFGGSPKTERRLEWLFKAGRGNGQVTVVVRSERAGTISRQIELA